MQKIIASVVIAYFIVKTPPRLVRQRGVECDADGFGNEDCWGKQRGERDDELSRDGGNAACYLTLGIVRDIIPNSCWSLPIF